MVKSIAGSTKFSGVGKVKNKGYVKKTTASESEDTNYKYFDDEVSDDDTNGNIALASSRRKYDSDAEDDDEVFNLNGGSDSDEDSEEDSDDNSDDGSDDQDNLEDEVSIVYLFI